MIVAVDAAAMPDRFVPARRQSWEAGFAMAKLKMVGPSLKTVDTRTVKPAPKRADAELLSADHRQWREQVMMQAGFRCQWVEGGHRCERRAPQHRMFADHIVERRDGGAPLDPNNGQCLCGKHHTLKTTRARAARLGLA